jgi:hypothetical protein
MKRILNNKLYQQGGGQSGNPIQQFGNATDLYEKLMSNALSTDAFKNFLNPKSTGNIINDVSGKVNRLKQAVPGAALSSLFDLAEMSKISAMQKPLFQTMTRKTASRMGQEGGEQEMQQMPEEAQPDINDTFSILKQYAEDRGFTNEDGSINKNNMRELLLLLESDVEAELEREKLMEIAPLFAEEKDPEEAIRNYWNRGVIPMNRRQDVLEFGNPDVQFLQEGRNFKEPSDEAYRQKMGYKDNSPYKDMPQQTFDTDSITMEGVSEPLMAVANNGQSVVMQPGNDYYFPGATSVTEYPLNRMKMGGLLMAQDGETPTQEEIAQQKQAEAIDWLNAWRNSQRGSEMLRRSTLTPEEYERISSKRAEQLERVKPIKFLKTQGYHPTGVPFSGINYSDPIFGTPAQTYIYPYGLESPTTILHETGHAEDTAGKYIPKKDKELINSFRPKSFTESPFAKSNKAKNLTEKEKGGYAKFMKTYGNPKEVRQLINQVRFTESNDPNKVYDPFTEEVTPEVFEKMKGRIYESSDKNPLDILRQNFTDEQLIELFNSISANEDSNRASNLASQGGAFRYAQNGLSFRAVNDSLPVQTAKLFDPTGISSYPDVYYAGKDFIENPSWSNAGNLAINTIGALPVVGAAGKSAKAAAMISRLNKGTEIAKKIAQPISYANTLKNSMTSRYNTPTTNVPQDRYQTAVDSSRPIVNPTFRPQRARKNLEIFTSSDGGAMNSLLIDRYQDNGNVSEDPDNTLYYMDQLGPEATITASRVKPDAEVTYDGPEIIIRDKRKNPETFTDEQLQLEFSPVADSLREMANILNPGNNRIVQAYDTLDRRREADRLALALSEAVKMDGVAPSVYGIDDIAEKQAPQLMKDGGIPARYKSMGFTRVGQKKQSTRPGKKWMLLAKKGNQYKVVHGGDPKMKDFTQHGNKKR